MGNFLKTQIIPRRNQFNLRKSLQQQEQVSRSNLKFGSLLFTTGLSNEAMIYIAENIHDPSDRYFIKQSRKVYNNRRIDPLMNQLRLLTNHNSKCFVKIVFAFQDYQYVYWGTPAFDAFTLQEVLRYHTFTEQETKYVVMTLIMIIETAHRLNLCLVELSPKCLLVDATTGQIKLLEAVNSANVDQNYPSHRVGPVCPYSAPEILLMDKVLGESDFYSVGLIMYQMMTQRSAFREQSIQDRHQLLRETIEVVKSDLPQGWKPEATDFLIKLLIKNPSLRLGRYGSFEGQAMLISVKNHTWLRNYSWRESSAACRINLNESYFRTVGRSEPQLPKFNDKKQIKLIYNNNFQELFASYGYTASQKDGQKRGELSESAVYSQGLQ